MPVPTPMRGALPSPRSVLAAATPYVHAMTVGAPLQFLVKPARISMWGNDVHGDCVTAEEAFAKACNSPEIFISDADVMGWATRHGVLEGANIAQVMTWMQSDGFSDTTEVYDDGPHLSVNWTDADTLHSAICAGPVKIGVAADQIETAWRTTGGQTGWFGTGWHADNNEDHCVSLCGYGSLAWLASQLGVTVPAGVDANRQGYAMFTWNTIGIVDASSMQAVTHEAWLRQPTTVARNLFPNWQLLDNNPATVAIASDGAQLYQLHRTGLIWRYTGTPLTGWQELDNNPASAQIVTSGGHLYQRHNTGLVWRYTGTPLTGWQLLDNNAATIDIVGDGDDLYQLHNSGRIWKFTGTPLTGWQELDNNAATRKIIAANGHLYQLHKTGLIWRYTGTPHTGWQQIDNNPATVDIIADGNDLFQLHNTGEVWKFTGTPLTGWQELDNNPATKQISAAGGRLYQRHETGKIWKYVTPPMTGWLQIDGNPSTASILAAGGNLYQRHNTGLIWRYTGS